MINYDIGRGIDIVKTDFLQSTVIGTLIGIQTIELIIYVWWFRHRYKNDNGNIRKCLTEDVIRKRNIKNMTTFVGQFYGFITEYTFLISAMILTFYTDSQTQDFKALGTLLKFMDFAFLSIVEIVTSPALRTFMINEFKNSMRKLRLFHKK